jgi:CcmD family protein
MMAAVVRLLITVALCGVPVLLGAQPRQQEQQGQYVPIDQLPPQEQLASAPLLIGAYSFVLMALFVYLVSLSRRMTAVQTEINRLESDLKRSSRA